MSITKNDYQWSELKFGGSLSASMVNGIAVVKEGKIQ